MRSSQNSSAAGNTHAANKPYRDHQGAAWHIETLAAP